MTTTEITTVVKKTLSWWSRLVEKVHDWDVNRRKNKWHEGLTAEDESDQLEIRQAESVIIQHQYLLHMAKARLVARQQWRRLQAEAVAQATDAVTREPDEAPH